ncbi:MAG: LptF/LptG family permease [Bacteroidales bacterium]|nr:LptF/LptG family permease [Bacteroidales bacterium]
MKIVNRYLCKNFLGPFFLTFFVALFVLLMQFVWKWVDELVGKGLELTVMLKLLFFAAVSLSSLAFPLAVMLASLMTFGNMGERYEIVALKSAGISTRQMMTPLAFLTVIITICSFLVSDQVIPRATLKLRMLLFDIQEQKPALNIEEGVFYDGFDNYSILVGKKMPDGETVKDILIYDHSKRQGNTCVTYAESGSMTVTEDKHYLLFTLRNGSYWDETSSMGVSRGKRVQMPLMRATFDKQYKRFDMSDFSLSQADASLFEGHSSAMTNKQLKEQIDTMRVQIQEIEENTANVFFNNLYFYNSFVRENEQFKTQEASKQLLLTDMPSDLRNRVLNNAENSSRSFIFSMQFNYTDAAYRTSNMWNFQIELQRKYRLAVACLLFFFIGAPLGSIIRKGGIAVPLVLTVLFFVIYFALSVIGEKIAKGSVMPVWFGTWLSSFILLPLCVFLTYHATMDTAVLSPDTYAKFVDRLKNIKPFAKKRHEDSSTLS